MKSFLLTGLFFLLIAANSIAGNIKGIIRNNAGHNLEYVTIRIDGTNQGTTTNSSGAFTLRNVKPGQYTLIASLINYESKNISLTVDDETIDLGLITLESSSQSLSEVVVSASANSYVTKYPANSIRLDEPLVEVPQNIQVVSSSIIASQQILSMSDGIVRNVSGATRQEHWGDLYTRINVRGGRAAAFREGMNITSTWGTSD